MRIDHYELFLLFAPMFSKGTNKCASQSGMSMGAARHVADIRADDMDKRGHGVIGLQMGSNKGASQSGTCRRVSL